MNWSTNDELRRIRENQEREYFERWQRDNPGEAEFLKKELEYRMQKSIKEREQKNKDREKSKKDNEVYEAILGGVVLIWIAAHIYAPLGMLLFIIILVYILFKVTEDFQERQRIYEISKAKKKAEEIRQARACAEKEAKRKNEWAQLEAIIPRLTIDEICQVLGLDDLTLDRTVLACQDKLKPYVYKSRRAIRREAARKKSDQAQSLDSEPQFSPQVTKAISLVQNSKYQVAMLMTSNQKTLVSEHFYSFEKKVKDLFYSGAIKRQTDYFDIVKQAQARLRDVGIAVYTSSL